MIRMQIQIDPMTRDALRRRAFEEGKSLAAVAREILEGALFPERAPETGRPRTAKDLFPFLGIIKDDPANVSENHDDYLFGEEEP